MAIPERIGRYRVLELLGRGAMGIVYRGLDEALDREVAIKVMAGQVEAEARARFKREAQAAARLQHPNIITVYELGEHQGAPFMALELLHGVDLQRAIEAGLRPDPRRTLPIVLQLLAGLGHAHERGIVHRDVKPSNLFLPRGGPAKIMDFGVARLASGTTAAGGGLTSTGMVIGTPNYMSPEQVRAGELDGRSDLFSAGLILYELVTGEKAYRGDSIVSLLFKIANEDPNLSLLPRGDRWLALKRLLERGLQREPARRYPDAATMHAELLAAWRELGGTGDWSAGVELGIGPRPKPRAVELGTANPPLAPSVSLGTLPSEPASATDGALHPPTSAQAPMRAALVLGVGAVVVLGATASLLLLRAPETELAPARLVTPVAPVASPTPPPAAPTLPATAPAATPTATRPRPSPTAPPPRASSSPTPAASEEPPTQGGRVDRAEQLLEAGRYSAALAEARAVLQRGPTNAQAQQVAEEAEAALLIEACLKNAKAALERGDKDTALEELRRGLAVNSNEARLLALWREATQ